MPNPASVAADAVLKWLEMNGHICFDDYDKETVQELRKDLRALIEDAFWGKNESS